MSTNPSPTAALPPLFSSSNIVTRNSPPTLSTESKALEAKADEEFNDPKATVVLLSSDGITFRMHQYYLMANRLAKPLVPKELVLQVHGLIYFLLCISSVFRDMLDTPMQPSNIPVTETAQTLRTILKIICTSEADIGSLDLFPDQYATADHFICVHKAYVKYDLQKGHHIFENALKIAAKKEPLVTFVYACSIREEAWLKEILPHFSGTRTFTATRMRVDATPWGNGGLSLSEIIGIKEYASWVVACEKSSYVMVDGKKVELAGRIEIDWEKASKVFKLL